MSWWQVNVRKQPSPFTSPECSRFLVKLLVKFFGAMFEVDHKAGILASSTALSRIVDMKSFQAQSGNDIIQQVCALKDDFPRQLPSTRLTVYTMLRKVLSHPDVAKDLQRRHGEASTFMRDLVQLCRSERDPDCLMVWFDTLRIFLVRYSASEEVLEEVYGCFKTYFPITLPRTSQSGVTPEELKQQLRHCFSASSLLAKHVFPFLLGKVDQGDAITVNVKVNPKTSCLFCVSSWRI
jgi:DNA repair/transcription protein MET18/MMS19